MTGEEIIKALKKLGTNCDLNMYASPHLLGKVIREYTGKKVTWKRVGDLAKKIGLYDVEYDARGFDVRIDWSQYEQ